MHTTKKSEKVIATVIANKEGYSKINIQERNSEGKIKEVETINVVAGTPKEILEMIIKAVISKYNLSGMPIKIKMPAAA